MKLRIRGNSIRLRLGQSEVQRLAKDGAIEESTRFDASGSQCLVYQLEAVSSGSVSASFAAGKLLVRLPADMVRRWAASSQVTIEATQALDAGNSLKILVEKDFECIDTPKDEPQDDAFPRPQGIPCPPIDGRV